MARRRGVPKSRRGQPDGCSCRNHRAFHGTFLSDLPENESVSIRGRPMTSRSGEPIAHSFSLRHPVNPAPPGLHLQNAKLANLLKRSGTLACFAKSAPPSASPARHTRNFSAHSSLNWLILLGSC